jgi:hypothetical protein
VKNYESVCQVRRPALITHADPKIDTSGEEYHQWIARDKRRQKDLFALYREEPAYFFYDCLSIRMKTGFIGPLDIGHPLYHRAQKRFYGAVMKQWRNNGQIRVSMLKARQWGGSTDSQGWLHWLAYVWHMHGTCMVICDDTDGSEAMFRMGKYMYESLPDWIRPDTKYDSAGMLKFTGKHPVLNEKINSEIVTETAQKARAGRKYTLHGVHCSEVAFWGAKAPEVLGGMSQAIPENPGTIYIKESTAFGHGGAFHETFTNAGDGVGGDLAFFVPWCEIDEYSLDSTDMSKWEHPAVKIDRDEWLTHQHDEEWRRLNLTQNELEILELVKNVTPAQLAWRRRKLVEGCRGDPDLFRQEYPITPDEAFIQHGQSVFSLVELQEQRDKHIKEPECGMLIEVGKSIPDEPPTEMKWLPNLDGRMMIWEKPDPTLNYVMAIDPAEGTEAKYLDGGTLFRDSDRSCVTVVNANTRELAAAVHGLYTPRDVGHMALLLACHYSECIVGIEMNGGFGAPVLEVFRNRGYDNLYTEKVYNNVLRDYTYRYGWTTGKNNRMLAFENARGLVKSNKMPLRWTTLLDEMMSMVYTPLASGGVKPEAKTGCHDDAVMSWVICQQILTELYEALFVDEIIEKAQMDQRRKQVWDQVYDSMDNPETSEPGTNMGG